MVKVFPFSRRHGIAALRLASFVLMVMLFAMVAPARAASITVDSSDDNATAGDGSCTLREAINNANDGSDTTSGDCTAGETGGNTIEAPANVGTITIASQFQVFQSPLTINGNGVTINAAALTGSAGLIVVHASGSLTMSETTLEGGGNTGQGNIHTAGNISLSNVTISDIAPTAITTDLSSSITMTLTNMLFEDSVGAYNSHLQNGTAMNISNHSTITVNNVVLRRLFGGNAAFNIRPNANAQSTITLTGCLTASTLR